MNQSDSRRHQKNKDKGNDATVDQNLIHLCDHISPTERRAVDGIHNGAAMELIHHTSDGKQMSSSDGKAILGEGLGGEITLNTVLGEDHRRDDVLGHHQVRLRARGETDTSLLVPESDIDKLSESEGKEIH
jgi:hypothetical protein